MRDKNVVFQKCMELNSVSPNEQPKPEPVYAELTNPKLARTHTHKSHSNENGMATTAATPKNKVFKILPKKIAVSALYKVGSSIRKESSK